MALFAGQPVVLPVERELRFAVVKCDPRDPHTLPALGVVARFAMRRKRPMMRILVAAAARCKIDSLVLDDLGIRPLRLMALRALYVSVFPRQREVRRRMIEGLHRFPSIEIVARLAVVAELPGVMIFVARQTGRMQTLERMGKVLDHNDLPVRRRDVLGVVALLAFQLRMLAEQRVAGLLVVEFLLGGIPLEDAEILAIMLGVAAGAVGVAFAPVDHAPVHAFMRSHQLGDLAMTVETLQLGFAGSKTMTVCAL